MHALRVVRAFHSSASWTEALLFYGFVVAVNLAVDCRPRSVLLLGHVSHAFSFQVEVYDFDVFSVTYGLECALAFTVLYAVPMFNPDAYGSKNVFSFTLMPRQLGEFT